MTNHPLTDEIIEEIAEDVFCYDYSIPIFKCDMRAAADWQLEQVIEWLRSTPSREYVHLWDCDAEMDKDELITDLIKAMRPQQQEDN